MVPDDYKLAIINNCCNDYKLSTRRNIIIAMSERAVHCIFHKNGRLLHHHAMVGSYRWITVGLTFIGCLLDCNLLCRLA